MEAMWTRFLPHIVPLGEILAARTLGDVVYLTAEHGQWFAPDPQFRLFAPELAGGALLDLGISSASVREPGAGRAEANHRGQRSGVYRRGRHDVDDLPVRQRCWMWCSTTTLRAASGNPAAIYGTAARIEIMGLFFTPTAFRVIGPWRAPTGAVRRTV